MAILPLPIPRITAPNWGKRLNDAINSRYQENSDRITIETAARIAGDEGRAPLISDTAHNISMWEYGNSYASYTICSASTYYDRLIQKVQSPLHGNWGVPSMLSADICSYMYGTFTASVQFASAIASSRSTGAGTWTQSATASLGTNGVVILETIRNDAGLDAVTTSGGTTAKSRAGYVNAIDAMIRLIRAKSRVENNDAAWTYTAGWANAAGFPGLSGGNRQATTTANSTGTITIGGDCDLILVGIDDSALGVTGSAFQVRIDGVLFASGTTSNQTRKTQFTSGLTAGGNYGFGQLAVPIRGLSAGSHTLEVKHTGSAGHLLMLDCLLAPRDGTPYPPPTIIIPKNPEFSAAGYASYVALGGTTASRAVDLIYNGLLDGVIANFPAGEVIAWDPMEHGFNAAIHIGNKDGASVHLNDTGTAFYANGLFDLINGLPPRDGLIRL